MGQQEKAPQAQGRRAPAPVFDRGLAWGLGSSRGSYLGFPSTSARSGWGAAPWRAVTPKSQGWRLPARPRSAPGIARSLSPAPPQPGAVPPATGKPALLALTTALAAGATPEVRKQPVTQRGAESSPRSMRPSASRVRRRPRRSQAAAPSKGRGTPAPRTRVPLVYPLRATEPRQAAGQPSATRVATLHERRAGEHRLSDPLGLGGVGNASPVLPHSPCQRAGARLPAARGQAGLKWVAPPAENAPPSAAVAPRERRRMGQPSDARLRPGMKDRLPLRRAQPREGRERLAAWPDQPASSLVRQAQTARDRIPAQPASTRGAARATPPPEPLARPRAAPRRPAGGPGATPSHPTPCRRKC